MNISYSRCVSTLTYVFSLQNLTPNCYPAQPPCTCPCQSVANVRTTSQDIRLRETPYTTPSGLPPAISENTASQLPRKGGYPQLQGRGYHSSPRSSGDISISLLGVSRGHRNVPHTSHCLSKATPDSSRLRRPPSRTLLLCSGSFLQDPLSLSLSLRTIQLFTVRLSSL